MKNRLRQITQFSFIATALLMGLAAMAKLSSGSTSVDQPTVRQMLHTTDQVNSFNGLGSAKDLNCAIKPTARLASSRSFGRTQAGLSRDFYAHGANCEGFIQKDGSYGEWGESIERGFNENPRFEKALLSEHAAKNRSLKQICPNYGALGREDRIRFWVWSMAAIAWKESTCRVLGAKRCSKSNCVGLMQLNEPRHMRAWRGKACAVSSVASANNTLLCSLDIMRGQFEGIYGKPGGLFPNSYWQELRKNGKSPIKSRMMKFPGCQPGPAQRGPLQRERNSNERRTV